MFIYIFWWTLWCVFLWTMWEAWQYVLIGAGIYRLLLASIVAILHLCQYLSKPYKKHLYHLTVGAAIGLCISTLAVHAYWWRNPIPDITTTYRGDAYIQERYDTNRYIAQLDIGSPHTILLIFSEQQFPIAPDFSAGDRLHIHATRSRIWRHQTPPQTRTWAIPSWEHLHLVFREMQRWTDTYRQRRWYMRGRSNSLRVRSYTHREEWSWSRLDTTRQRILDRMLYTFSDPGTRGLISWLLIGERSQLSAEQYNLFIASGLIHLLVVSGGNIVMVTGRLNMLFFWLPVRWRRFVCGGGIIIYGMLCGADSTVMRAVVMWLLSLVVMILGRELPPRRAIGYVVVILMLLNPYFLRYDVWFSLSIWAVSGITLVSAVYRQYIYAQWHIHISKIAQILLPLCGATYGVLPRLLLIGGERNIFSLIPNMVLVPLMPFYLFSWWVALLVASLLPTRGWIPVRRVETLSQRVFSFAARTDTAWWYLHTPHRRRQILFLVARYGSGYILYQKTTSSIKIPTRTPGFEPGLSASETDVLPVTLRPYPQKQQPTKTQWI